MYDNGGMTGCIARHKAGCACEHNARRGCGMLKHLWIPSFIASKLHSRHFEEDMITDEVVH